MARLPRIAPADVPIHIIQRGNNRQVCFAAGEDYGAYIVWLTEYAKKYMVEVHAWVMMSNHVHLLCTPRREGSVSLMMQSLGRRYVRYFNHQYQRSGTLWEGRYKSGQGRNGCGPRRLSLVKLPSQCPGAQIRIMHSTFGFPCFGCKRRREKEELSHPF